MSQKTYVILHGHFYQPPRENPWTGQIELQSSATPYHDWNERVAAECYTPNARSRVLDDQGRILDVINNYAHISFNFGPTLLSWMEEHANETYARIIEADRLSIARWGHGNAMAQGYNHVIMPLADPRDRWTQIQWGLADFRARFGREAKGIWLAETALDEISLSDLARAGIQFIILAPSQAELIRGRGEQAWIDVVDGSIPTGRPYRCVTPQGEVTIFFYHGGVSKAVAFEHVLRNAATFVDKIAAAAAESLPPGDDSDRLAMVATDGESYGHHEAMGDMCLAYTVSRELAARGLTLTNPAAFLAEHPPEWEVRLKAGGQGKGTAWSCAHGVGRWMEDCGCTTGGPPSWNQAWRAPLRKSFDLLRQRLDPLFEQEGTKLLTNPWAARDDYVQVLLGKKVGVTRGFIDRHQKHELSDLERERVFVLMEMQLHGMLMYTSCAWFFADLSGIETIQNLAYFARAAQLAEIVAGHPITVDSMKALAEARSNLSSMGNGLEILTRFVRPAMLSPAKVAAHLAISALLADKPAAKRLYGFRAKSHSEHREARAGHQAFCGKLTVRAKRTGEGGTFDVAVLAGGSLRLVAFVRTYEPEADPVSVDDLLSAISRVGFDQACLELDEKFSLHLVLPDMLSELRLAAMGVMIRPVIKELGQTFDELYRRHEDLLRQLTPLGVGLPEALKAPVGYAASRSFDRRIARGLPGGDLAPAAELAELAHSLGIPLRLGRPTRRLVKALANRLEGVLADPKPENMAALRDLIDAARQMGLDPDEPALQDRVAERLEPLLEELLDPKSPGGTRPDAAQAWVDLAGYLNLNVTAARKRLAKGQT